MSLIPIEYVGKKPFSIDNVAGSGKCWKGAGDVQEVTAAQAKTLLKYPDQWALKNPEDAEAVGQPVTITVEGKDGKETIDKAALAKPVEKMTKPELQAYAVQRFGKELPAAMAKQGMVDQLQEWEKDLPPVTGSQAAT